ncbi:MAG: sigma 54-interacting transcriptional regulator [Deltaproteobacteria bacterium]|nr:sigma 54-interacting transcriptional regulator [Deltaproteobacteria bacterium]
MSTDARSRPTAPARILIVDDDPDLLRLLTMRLSAAGYAVVIAGTGEAALTQMAAARPDLVITDLRMEGMDGLALFDAIRVANASVPVIMLTAHGSIPDAVTATQRGIFSFLTKPFQGKELLSEVEKALRLSAPNGGRKLSGNEEVWRREIVTRSPLMEDLLAKARLAAQSDASVLILGDSGTGKELLARAIHRASPRESKPFQALNCGAIPEQLLESELFGHSKGSFTGAIQDHEGLFQAAQGGTVLLDEIGDMPPSLQVKLLRVLQEKQVRPVGSTRPVDIDVRIVSATHRDLEMEIGRGSFREDLYYRLNVIALRIPSLEERREDIPLLANHFLSRLSERNRKKITGLAPDALEILLTASWPGNVRHLLNVVEQAVALSTTPIVSAALVSNALQKNAEEVLSFDQARRRFEQQYLVKLLQMSEGNVTHAARLAGRNRTDFYKLLSRHKIDPALFKPHHD